LPALFADKRATLQMMLNLLSNAVKFTPRGGAIAATAVARADGGITLSVRDSGIGIAKADIPKALAVYSQVDSPEVRKHDGTGLGLPIVQALMKLHGGALDLDGEAGQGTSVSLHLAGDRCATARRRRLRRVIPRRRGCACAGRGRCGCGR
jgi:signal transduction histidine kinase